MGNFSEQLWGTSSERHHAIDAAVITAAQYLSEHDGDYAGASARVKEIIRQNLGIDPASWPACDDPNHLDVSAPNDTTCISFRRIAATATTQVKNDIRVRLPSYRMDTIFGSALGLDSIDLAATAASNGNNCGAGTSQACGPGTSAATTTTTAPPSPTTTTNQQFCDGHNALTFALYDDIWVRCSEFYPNGDVQAWRIEFCHDDNVDIPWPTGDIHYTLDEIYRFIWFWTSVCEQYGPGVGVRDRWLNDVCFNGTPSYIFSDYGLWIECKQRRPSLDDWNHYYSTTTTQPQATTSPQATTTLAPPTSVPSSIDLSN